MSEYEEWRDNHKPEGYMCKVDFECELGGACGGNTIYPSLEDLKEHRKCWESCGVVKVRVEFVEEIVPERDYE